MVHLVCIVFAKFTNSPEAWLWSPKRGIKSPYFGLQLDGFEPLLSGRSHRSICLLGLGGRKLTPAK